MVVTGSKTGEMIVWDLASRQALRKLAVHKGPIHSMDIVLEPLNLGNADFPKQLLPVCCQTLSKFQNRDVMPTTVDANASLSMTKWQALLESDDSDIHLTAYMDNALSAKPDSTNNVQQSVGILEQLQAENEHLKRLNSHLYTRCVSDVMNQVER
jgi:hypothetical protein